MPSTLEIINKYLPLVVIIVVVLVVVVVVVGCPSSMLHIRIWRRWETLRILKEHN